MKLTIEGSTLASRLKPLATPIRQHEGNNYDSIDMAITEEDGKKYLLCRIEQPAYEAYLHQNLSGKGTDADSDDLTTAVAIDPDAELSDNATHIHMKASDLANLNRNVGAAKAVYDFSSCFGLETRIEERTFLHKNCTLRQGKVPMPTHCDSGTQQDVATHDGAFLPMGMLDAIALSKALGNAIRMCRLTGCKGELRAQAVHLDIAADEVRVEAISHNGAVSTPITNFMGPDIDRLPEEGVHLALNLAAAQALKQMCDISGTEMRWTFDAESKVLTLSCNEYRLRVFTEEVSECKIPEGAEVPDVSLLVTGSDMQRALSKVKVSGNDVVLLSYLEGRLRIETDDKCVNAFVSTSICGNGHDFSDVSLPSHTLLAALQAFDADNVYLDYDSADQLIVVHDGSMARAVVFEV